MLRLLGAVSRRMTNRGSPLVTLISRTSQPSEFEIGDPVVQHGAPSPYLPFHMVEPGKWPELILAEGFLQRDRDNHTEIDNGGNE